MRLAVPPANYSFLLYWHDATGGSLLSQRFCETIIKLPQIHHVCLYVRGSLLLVSFPFSQSASLHVEPLWHVFAQAPSHLLGHASCVTGANSMAQGVADGLNEVLNYLQNILMPCQLSVDNSTMRYPRR